MVRWGMVIDLRKCIGCEECVIVCKHTNKLPSHIWRKVVDCGVSEPPRRQRTFLPTSCMHCSKPACQEVCPSTATYQRPDGIVDINYERCVGCGYCIVACPYDARKIIEIDSNIEVGTMLQESGKNNRNHDLIGVCTKCNFCMSRVDEGLAKGLQPGLDPDATPMCVVSCSVKALHFGDLKDPDSEVSRLISENKTISLQEELGTDPSVYYIIDDITPEIKTGDKKQLVQPKKQEVWGWLAVSNFVLGGTAAGFYLLYLLMTNFGGIITGASQTNVLKLLAPVLAMLGFLGLTIEAGRPMRGLHLLRHLHRSWMSGETLAGTVFILTVILDWLFPHMLLWIPGAIAALGLLISQGFIVYRALALSAWNMPLMPLLFVTSGFATGEGLVLLLTAMGKLTLGYGQVMIGIICVVLNLIIWLLYLCLYHDGAFREATETLRHPIGLISTIGIGHLLPILLLLFVVAHGIDADVELRDIFIAFAGLAIITGGVIQKASIILKVGYVRGIVMGYQKLDEKDTNPDLGGLQLNSQIDTSATVKGEICTK